MLVARPGGLLLRLQRALLRISNILIPLFSISLSLSFSLSLYIYIYYN